MVLALLDNLTGLSVRLFKVRRTNLEESKRSNVRYQNQHESGNRHALTLAGAILDHDQSDYGENNGRDGQERINDKDARQGGNNAQNQCGYCRPLLLFRCLDGCSVCGLYAGACWVNCGCCGATGCGVFSDMKVLISYVVGEYPEAHHPQVAYLSQGYSMCLNALTS